MLPTHVKSTSLLHRYVLTSKSLLVELQTLPVRGSSVFFWQRVGKVEENERRFGSEQKAVEKRTQTEMERQINRVTERGGY